jgi:tRNA G18 (ribose-2'-O)-methylase SpoU
MNLRLWRSRPTNLILRAKLASAGYHLAKKRYDFCSMPSEYTSAVWQTFGDSSSAQHRCGACAARTSAAPPSSEGDLNTRNNRPWMGGETKNRAASLHVVLVSTRNPLNIGAAARAMSNFGFSNLRVVNPHDVAFQEARSAVGASELLRRAQHHQSLAAAVADCTLVVGTTAAQRRKLVHSLHSLE